MCGRKIQQVLFFPPWLRMSELETIAVPIRKHGVTTGHITYDVKWRWTDPENRPGEKTYFIYCDLCGKDYVITTNGNTTSFEQHCDSNTCHRLSLRRDKLQSEAEQMPPPATPRQSQVQLPPVDADPSPLLPSTVHTRAPLTQRPRSLTAPTAPAPRFIPHPNFSDLPPSSPPREDLIPVDESSLISSGLWSSASSAQVPEPLVEFHDAADGDPPMPGSLLTCNGVLVEWEPGVVWKTYPFDIHGRRSIPWEVIGSDSRDGKSFIRLLSYKCRAEITSVKEKISGACTSCSLIPSSSRFTKLVARMKQEKAPSHTAWEYLNQNQILGILRTVTRQNKELRSKVQNLERKVKASERRITDYQRILTFISEYDVPGLRRLLAVALRRGASPKVMLARLEDCVQGIYRPHGDFRQRDYDIAFLAKALGGPRLLYALQHAFGLPSVTTLSRNSHVPELRPCLSNPTTDDIEYAINTLFKSDVRAAPQSASIKAAGKVLMMDGVAIEEVCRYDQQRNAVMGLCREHSHRVGLMVDDYASIESIEVALKGDACHIGKDATVLALGSLADAENYTPIPILVSASCKTETGDELARWLELFLSVWRRHPYGETLHGPIVTIASDGESTFRSARFQIAMSEDMDTSTGFGRVLGQMRGLNLQTGAFGLLATCDPKHIFKRFATLLRSISGIQISDTTITTVQIVHRLSELPDVGLDEAAELMDPADKQNVPKAVKLIQKLSQLYDASSSLISTDQDRLKTISFLAETLTHFLLPFIDAQMSLSEQVRSLSVYAHLTYAMYKKHGLSFLTGALYADSHAVIKNIMFTIARLQRVDRTLLYFLILEGTDRLEMIFSHIRTQDHSRNFDVLQLIQKLSIAAELVAVFLRQPDLNRGHRRRDVMDAEGVDHINPKSIRQDNKSVGDVDLPREWSSGLQKANDLLEKHLGFRYDYDKDFAVPKHDMLRPGGEAYVGSRWTPEDDLSEEGHRNAAEEAETSLSVPDPFPPPLSETNTSQTSSAQTLDVSREDDALSPSTVAASSDAGHDVGPYLNGLEDWLQSSSGGPEHVPSVSSSSSSSHSTSVKIDGKAFRKDSIIPSMLRSEGARKATIRTLRAAGVTQRDAMRLHGLKFEVPRVDTESETSIRSGDLAATLVHAGDYICLAVVEVLHFERADAKKQIYDVESDSLSDRISAICQIVSLRSMGAEVPSKPEQWIWEKGYVLLDAKATVTGQKHYLLRVPSLNLHLLAPDLMINPSPTANSGRIVYVRSIPHEDLTDTLEYAWERLDPSSENFFETVALLPQVNNPAVLPYRDVVRGTSFFFVEDRSIAQSTKKLDAKANIPCKLCDTTVKLSSMRNHVGRHLLMALHNLDDRSVARGGIKIGANPCGWCGLDTCRTTMTKKGTKITISSNCAYHYAKMSYAAAANVTRASPCSNVPIHCSLCQRTIWKYNARYHLVTEHSYLDGVRDALPELPDQMWVDIYISSVEEKAQGIDLDTMWDYRRTNFMPDSDFIEDIKQDLRQAVSKGRTRANTGSTSHRPYKLPRIESNNSN